MQFDLGVGIIALRQQAQVQGGGGLFGLEHQSVDAVVHHGGQVLHGAAEGSHAGRHIQGQHRAVLPGSVQHLAAKQALDAVVQLQSVALSTVGTNEHDVALDGRAFRCAIAAVGGVLFANGHIAVGTDEHDVALDGRACRGTVATVGGVLFANGHVGSKCAYAEHGNGTGSHRSGSQGTGKFMILQFHRKILLFLQPGSGCVFHVLATMVFCGKALNQNRRICLVNECGGWIIAGNAKNYSVFSSPFRMAINSSPVMVSFS